MKRKFTENLRKNTSWLHEFVYYNIDSTIFTSLPHCKATRESKGVCMFDLSFGECVRFIASENNIIQYNNTSVVRAIVTDTAQIHMKYDIRHKHLDGILQKQLWIKVSHMRIDRTNTVPQPIQSHQFVFGLSTLFHEWWMAMTFSTCSLTFSFNGFFLFVEHHRIYTTPYILNYFSTETQHRPLSRTFGWTHSTPLVGQIELMLILCTSLLCTWYECVIGWKIPEVTFKMNFIEV